MNDYIVNIATAATILLGAMLVTIYKHLPPYVNDLKMVRSHQKVTYTGWRKALWYVHMSLMFHADRQK